MILTNPDHLGRKLGVDGKKMRWFLRQQFPRPRAEKYRPWEITLDMVIAAVRRFGTQGGR